MAKLACLSHLAIMFPFTLTVYMTGALLYAPWLTIVAQLQGGDLREALSSSNGERWQWNGGQMGRQVLQDVAKGLHFLHSHSVIHADLKSSNILLARDGTAKVCFFVFYLPRGMREFKCRACLQPFLLLLYVGMLSGESK